MDYLKRVLALVPYFKRPPKSAVTHHPAPHRNQRKHYTAMMCSLIYPIIENTTLCCSCVTGTCGIWCVKGRGEEKTSGPHDNPEVDKGDPALLARPHSGGGGNCLDAQSCGEKEYIPRAARRA